MLARRLIQVAAIAAALIAPLAAFAGTMDGEVVVAPAVTAQAPAIGGAPLAFLAAGLFIAAAVVLRRRSAPLASGLAAVVAGLMLVTAGYAAFETVIITGTDCDETTSHHYVASSGAMPTLVSDCENPITVVELNLTCEEEESPLGEVPPLCAIGTVLQNAGDECRLPFCER